MPTEMCAHEAIELKNHLAKLGFDETTLIFNNCFTLTTENNPNLPDFIKSKIAIEQHVLLEFKNEFKNKIAHITETSPLEIIKKLTTLIKDII